MASDRLVRLCARALHLKADSLTDSSGPGSVPGWDSLGMMTLLASIDEEFGVRLSLSTAARLRSIADLRDALRAKGVADV